MSERDFPSPSLAQVSNCNKNN